jgi:uncharacterized membrane protein
MTAMFGTALVCLALLVFAVRDWGRPYAVPMLLGSALYLVGVVALTIFLHVPLN